jgi:hypothetical protein
MTPEEVINLTNQYRKSQGLPAVKMNKQLMAAATERAKDMAKTGAFSHTVATTSPNVTWHTFIDKSGYPYQHAGENLATLFDDAPSMVTAWQNSPAHNKNLVRPDYTDIGIAVVPVNFQGKQTNFVVQFFGNQRTGQATVPAPQATPKTAPKAAPRAAPAQTKAPQAAFTKLGFKPDMGMAQTTPQAIPNKIPPGTLSL